MYGLLPGVRHLMIIHFNSHNNSWYFDMQDILIIQKKYLKRWDEKNFQTSKLNSLPSSTDLGCNLGAKSFHQV